MAIVFASARLMLTLLAGALSAAVLLWERLTGQSLPRTIPPDESVSAAGNANLAAGLFDNPNLLAYQCSVVLLLLPAAWSALPRPWRHLLVPFGAGLLAIDVWDGRPSVVVGTGLPGDKRVRVLQPGEQLHGVGLHSVDVAAGKATFSVGAGSLVTLDVKEAMQPWPVCTPLGCRA